MLLNSFTPLFYNIHQPFKVLLRYSQLSPHLLTLFNAKFKLSVLQKAFCILQRCSLLLINLVGILFTDNVYHKRLHIPTARFNNELLFLTKFVFSKHTPRIFYLKHRYLFIFFWLSRFLLFNFDNRNTSFNFNF